MITPRIKPSSFFPEEAADDLFVAQQRKAKLEGYVQTLAAMRKLPCSKPETLCGCHRITST